MPLLDQPLQLILILFMLSIFPLALVLGSSFLKIAIVFSLLRNALGIQQTPPNIAIYGLALVLTLFTMAPIILAIQSNLINEPIEIESPLFIQKVERNILLPYREFLKKNTDPEQQFFFPISVIKFGLKSIMIKFQMNLYLSYSPLLPLANLLKPLK